ncbi:hypothetical protein IJD44_00705 [bacterium]|nr:hypothetical protein [bacterium]
MAQKRFKIDGYGQLELNQVAFPRDGRIEAQCALDPTDFEAIPAEVGMLLMVDNIARKIKLPVAGSIFPIALNYSTEFMYDERTQGLKHFKLEKDGIYPRLGYLAIGDKFTTNCLAYDDGEFADEEAVKEAYKGDAPLYGGVSESGAILVSATAPTEGPVLLAIHGCGAGSMPDGQFAIQFQAIKA